MGCNNRINRRNISKIAFDNEYIDYKNERKSTKSINNITERVMQGLMFIIKQDKDVVTISEQMTTFKLSNELNKLGITAIQENRGQQKFENITIARNKCFGLQRKRNISKIDNRLFRLREIVMELKNNEEKITNTNINSEMRKIPNDAKHSETVNGWTQLFKKKENHSMFDEAIHSIENLFNNAETEMNCDSEEEDIVLKFELETNEVLENINNNKKNNSGSSNDEIKTICNGQKNADESAKMNVISCTLTLNCINKIENCVELCKITSTELIQNYRTYPALIYNVKNRSFMQPFFANEVLKTNIKIMIKSQPKNIKKTRSKAKDQYVVITSINSLKDLKKQARDSTDVILLQKLRIDAINNKNSKTGNKIIRINTVKLISDLTHGIKVIVKRLKLENKYN
jgi:hypothetical protein